MGNDQEVGVPQLPRQVDMLIDRTSHFMQNQLEMQPSSFPTMLP